MDVVSFVVVGLDVSGFVIVGLDVVVGIVVVRLDVVGLDVVGLVVVGFVDGLSDAMQSDAQKGPLLVMSGSSWNVHFEPENIPYTLLYGNVGISLHGQRS